MEKKVKICWDAVVDKKGDNVIVFDLQKRVSFTDYFLICSGSSVKQVQSIADEIVERLKLTGMKGITVEGYQTGRWVLVDCIDIIIHIFHAEARKFYDLERLWGDAPLVEMH